MNNLAWLVDLPHVEVPSPSAPIYPAVDAPSKTDPIPLFEHDTWPVRFFSNNPTMQDVRIYWRTIPAPYRAHFRLATWALFNVPVPSDLLAQRAAPMVATLSALRIYHTVIDWRLLARWMETTGIRNVTDLDTDSMTAYVSYLRYDRRIARATMVNHLSAITRLWIVGRQIPELALRNVPPWVVGAAGDYLPRAAVVTGENAIDPIRSETMSSLLNAANQFIEVGAEAILKAATLDRDVRAFSRADDGLGGRSAAQRLDGYLDKLKEAGAGLPVKRHSGETRLDCSYVAYLNRVELGTVYRWARRPDVRMYAAALEAETMVQFVDHELLPPSVPFTTVGTYVSLLRAACFTVIAYLTGMRPGEVLALEAGSLRPSSAEGGWMLIRSRTFKTARDSDGNHDSNGKIRVAPWVAVAPVVRAMRVLERLCGGNGLLFPSVQHLRSVGRSQGLSTAAESVVQFIDYVNERCPGRVPADPLGRVSPVRFRRTLAWHIANQPGGTIALAVQYGHLRTAISEGYASRVRDGIHDLVDLETASNIARNLSEIADAMNDGEGVSGPAASRLVTALREQNEQFRGLVTSQRQARALLNNPRLTVYQNDAAFLWCNFNRETALCLNSHESERATSPSPERCKENCSNIARTDRQAVLMNLSATRLRDDAAVMPRPAAERLLARADKLASLAEKHDAERLTLGTPDADLG